MDRRKPALPDLTPPPRKANEIKKALTPVPPPSNKREEEKREEAYLPVKKKPPERPVSNGPRRPQNRSHRPAQKRAPVQQRRPRRQLAIPTIPPWLKRVAGILVGVTAFSVIGFFIISNVFAHNAIAVHVNGELIGHIDLDRELILDDFRRYVINHLEREAGTEVDITGNTIIASYARRVTTRDRETPTALFNRIAREIDFMIAAQAIYVNGRFEALVRSPGHVVQVEDQLQESYARLPNVVETRFNADWQVRTRFVDSNDPDLRNVSEVVNILDRRVLSDYIYIVQSGDNLTRIAQRYETTAAEIALASGIFVDSGLAIGQRLTLRTMQPLLPVLTIHETVEIVRIPMETITEYNPNLGELQINEIQPGSDGMQRIATRITKINGVQVGEPEILEAEIYVEPVPRIVEEGSRPDSIIRGG